MNATRARHIGIGLLTLASTMASACGGSSSHPREASRPSTPAQALALSTVIASDIPVSFEAGGVVRARTTATVAAQIMAPIVNISVRPGDVVRRGATLVVLDARELTAHTARAKATARSADDSVHAAQSQAAAADANARLARATYDRIKVLHEKRSATAQELDQADAALRAADAQVASASAQIAAATATREAAQAGADAADIGLSYTVLVAPFDGTVVSRLVDPGALAAPGMPLLVIEHSGGVRLEVTLDEARAGHVEIGQRVETRLDDDGSWLSGTVSEVGRVDPATHSFFVKVDLPPGTNRHTGTFGRARFTTGTRRAVTVPADALVRRGQLAFVFAVGPDRLARLRPVTPGVPVGDRVEILAGLVDGDVVVTAPPASLKDGTSITQSTAAVAPASEARR